MLFYEAPRIFRHLIILLINFNQYSNKYFFLIKYLLVSIIGNDQSLNYPIVFSYQLENNIFGFFLSKTKWQKKIINETIFMHRESYQKDPLVSFCSSISLTFVTSIF